ncbi:unnamed protein product, partial [Ectocarpus sp. 8 AP-2014]
PSRGVGWWWDSGAQRLGFSRFCEVVLAREGRGASVTGCPEKVVDVQQTMRLALLLKVVRVFLLGVLSDSTDGKAARRCCCCCRCSYSPLG